MMHYNTLLRKPDQKPTLFVIHEQNCRLINVSSLLESTHFKNAQASTNESIMTIIVRWSFEPHTQDGPSSLIRINFRHVSSTMAAITFTNLRIPSRQVFNVRRNIY